MSCISCKQNSTIIYNGLGWCTSCYNLTISKMKEYENTLVSVPTHPIHIIDNLYIGDINSSIDENILIEYNIRSIIVAGRSLQKKSFSNINYLKLEIDDSLEQNIKEYISLSNNFIVNALNNSSVLVHCYSGISRSASIIIGYLISFKNMNYDDAYQLVKLKSNRIHPNSNFENQLRSL